jgi:phosphatidate cytidylyltransferase
MALDVKKFLVRALSAAVFVIALLGSVVLGYVTFAMFFGVMALLGLLEFYRLSEKFDAKPFKALGIICGMFIYFVFINFPQHIIPNMIFVALKYLIVVIPLIILSMSVFSAKKNSFNNALYTFVGIVYAVLPFGLLNQLAFYRFEYAPKTILSVIFLIWANDTFAYLGGSIFGKHKLLERVSPGKTWEGTIFGILISFGISFIIKNYFLQTDRRIWLLMGILIPVLATFGDLLESQLKRQANVKDSGTLMPGHGGVLDRFDSLIFVAPFVYIIFKIAG